MEDRNLSNTKIVYDPQNKYQQANQSSNNSVAAPKPKWRDEDGDMIDWFFWMFRQAYCYIRRSETSEKRSFNKLYSGQTSLNSIREKLIEMKVYLNGKWEYMNEIDKEFAEKMGSTFSDFNPDNMSKATRVLFDLFEDTAKQYCDKAGKQFPEEKAVAMRLLFDEFDQVEK